MALFAPELVVYTAWTQYMFVKNMTAIMAKRGHKVGIMPNRREVKT